MKKLLMYFFIGFFSCVIISTGVCTGVCKGFFQVCTSVSAGVFTGVHRCVQVCVQAYCVLTVCSLRCFVYMLI